MNGDRQIFPARLRPAERQASTRLLLRCMSSAPALGLTQIQSRPAGAAIVPLVSTAISKPRACKRAIEGRHRAAAAARRRCRRRIVCRQRPLAGHFSFDCRGQLRGVANFPPPGPSVPTKSVSQNCRSPSRDPPRGPTRDCSPQSGRRPRRAPPARPRPAACRKFP